MWIGMAGVAAAYSIVGFARMAHAAGRDNLVFAYHWWMSLVTSHTGDSCFMFASLAFDSSLYTLMTLNTIGICELNCRFCCLFLGKTFLLV
jgi:hypothetical protein